MMRRRKSGTLRVRIAFAYIAGSLVLSGVVAGSTYGLAHTFLSRQRIDVVVRQSYNSLRFATEFLTRPEGGQTLDRLVRFLQARGTSDILVTDGRRSVPSSVSITQRTIPMDLRRTVARGEVGYTIFGSNPRRLVFGSQVPGTNLHAFFVYPLGDLDETLGVLARVLLGVVGGTMVVAGLLGFRLADRTIQPLRRASAAAQQVAEGLLETRLEESGRDELGRLAASFNSMAEALQDRIDRERRFVSDASHELRTPLTALKTSVDFLAERASDLPPRHGSAAQMAAEEVRSLQRLVDDLLELSRVEAGGVHLVREVVDLGAFAHEVVRRRGAGRPVFVSAPTGLVALTDKARLERVVGNLVENAVVHGEARDVEVVVEADGPNARITVSDSGPGIDPEQLSQIYERFWRADTARRRDSRSGAGLGLAIARENANVIGAELEVESEPGRGTKFTVTIPLQGGPVPPSPAASPRLDTGERV